MLPSMVTVELVGPKVNVEPPKTIFVTDELAPGLDDTGSSVNVIPPVVTAIVPVAVGKDIV